MTAIQFVHHSLLRTLFLLFIVTLTGNKAQNSFESWRDLHMSCRIRGAVDEQCSLSMYVKHIRPNSSSPYLSLNSIGRPVTKLSRDLTTHYQLLTGGSKTVATNNVRHSTVSRVSKFILLTVNNFITTISCHLFRVEGH